jgi:hypothetical protein
MGTSTQMFQRLFIPPQPQLQPHHPLSQQQQHQHTQNTQSELVKCFFSFIPHLFVSPLPGEFLFQRKTILFCKAPNGILLIFYAKLFYFILFYFMYNSYLPYYFIFILLFSKNYSAKICNLFLTPLKNLYITTSN